MKPIKQKLTASHLWDMRLSGLVFSERSQEDLNTSTEVYKLITDWCEAHNDLTKADEAIKAAAIAEGWKQRYDSFDESK